VIETQIWAPGWYLTVGPAELGLSLAPFMLDRAPIICNDSSPTDTDDSEAVRRRNAPTAERCWP
jgi:hypothetical protein